MKKIDIVTVHHNSKNLLQSLELEKALHYYLPNNSFTFTNISNIEKNRGFAAGCNLGATYHSNEIIGFLNPDVEVLGDFYQEVVDTINKGITITGNRFGKPSRELSIWKVKDWVCGATFFVERTFFEQACGFDERYFMYFEESDLIKRAEMGGYQVKSKELPLFHQSPIDDSEEDIKFKTYQFDRSAKLYYKKWSGRRG